MGECSLAQGADGTVYMYARVWWDDNTTRPTRAVAASHDGGITFGAGRTDLFPGNPGRDCQGAILAVNRGTSFLVGSPWGLDHFPRVNYSVLVSHSGTPAIWGPVAGAAPLWRGPAGYSSLAAPSADPSTFFVLYERGVQSPSEVLRLTQLAVPQPHTNDGA
mmetsp:Transcript_13996/g.41617  ORF Transcript_13996/g.41617 Transcript_13996/m.41617 type:complete len:162 (+) Transcript_13996:3-488(+)